MLDKILRLLFLFSDRRPRGIAKFARLRCAVQYEQLWTRRSQKTALSLKRHMEIWLGKEIADKHQLTRQRLLY